MNSSDTSIYSELKTTHSRLIRRRDQLKSTYNKSLNKDTKMLAPIGLIKVLEERMKFHLLKMEYGDEEPDYQQIKLLISKGTSTIIQTDKCFSTGFKSVMEE